jgi:malate synthase
VILDNGKVLNESYYHRLAMEEFEKIRNLVGDENHEKQQTGRTIIGRASCKRHLYRIFNPPGYKYI